MESTSEKLEHLEDLITVLIEGVKRIEEKKIAFPEPDDHKSSILEILKKLEVLQQQDEHLKLREQLSKQVTIGSNLLSVIELQKKSMTELINGFPKRIKTQVEHKFTGQTQPYIIVFVICMFLTMLSIVSSIWLLNRNSELKANDIKYREVRIRKPSWSMYTDSIYNENPDSVERTVKMEEEKAMDIEMASRSAEEKQREAEKARKHLKSLQK